MIFANITVATSQQKIAAYFEFSTRFSNELTVALQQKTMHSELQALSVRAVTELQKA